MKKKWFTAIIILLSVSLLLNGVSFLKPHTKPVVYTARTIFDDLYVRDFTFVYYDDMIFIPKGYHLDLREDTKLNELYVDMFIDNVLIYNLRGSDMSQNFIGTNLTIKTKIKLTDKSKLTIKVKYRINGETKAFTDEIPLKSIKDSNVLFLDS